MSLGTLPLKLSKDVGERMRKSLEGGVADGLARGSGEVNAIENVCRASQQIGPRRATERSDLPAVVSSQAGEQMAAREAGGASDQRVVHHTSLARFTFAR